MNKSNNFVGIINRIKNSKYLSLCDDVDELSGKHPSICVYNQFNDVVGKLRWPTSTMPASVDQEVISFLEKHNE